MRAVLWDMDGTLVDSADYHWRAWRETLALDGVTITPEQFLTSFGQRNDRILAAWLGDDTPRERVRRLGDTKEERYRALVAAEGIAPLPGASEWVLRLHAEGWRQAVASSAPRLNVEAVVGAIGLGPVFAALVAAEDVTAGKPDPQVFNVAAARLGVPASRCVVVEDAEAGLEAARRAGMRCIGIGRPGRLAADLVASTLADLAPDAFDRLLASSDAAGQTAQQGGHV